MLSILMVLVSFLLSACGDKVCVGSFGDCQHANQVHVPPPDSEGEFTVKVEKTTLTVSETLALKVTGGKKPYELSILMGGGTLNEEKSEYTAPDRPGYPVLRVEDAANKRIDIALVVTE